MKKIVLALLCVAIYGTQVSASGCGYPYLGIQLARAEESISGCWLNVDCWRASFAIRKLKKKTTVTDADIQLAKSFDHVSPEMSAVALVINHIIQDHKGLVANHNAVRLKDGV